MRFKLANGWTKSKVLAQVKKYNNGTRAAKPCGGCMYLMPDGNRCAVGAFIPDGHAALASESGVKDLLDFFWDLRELMPFSDGVALSAFQRSHDLCGSGGRPEGVIPSVTSFLEHDVEGEWDEQDLDMSKEVSRTIEFNCE